MIRKTVVMIAAALALAGCAGCKATGRGGGDAPLSTINQQYNEGAKMPPVQPSWK